MVYNFNIRNLHQWLFIQEECFSWHKEEFAHFCYGPQFYSAWALIYRQNNVYHRESGPALIRDNGHMKYYINGKLHRKDGPAYVSPVGNKYYIHGRHVTKTEWLRTKK